MPPKPMRLPPVPFLKVKDTSVTNKNPCVPVMTSVLACWASAGFSTTGCAALENALRQCMDSPPPARATKSTINYHLTRMYDRVIPNAKPKSRVKF